MPFLSLQSNESFSFQNSQFLWITNIIAFLCNFDQSHQISLLLNQNSICGEFSSFVFYEVYKRIDHKPLMMNFWNWNCQYAHLSILKKSQKSHDIPLARGLTAWCHLPKLWRMNIYKMRFQLCETNCLRRLLWQLFNMMVQFLSQNWIAI